MKKQKALSVLALSVLIALGANVPKSYAHGTGAIILLPIILVEELGKAIYNVNMTNFKLRKHDFKVAKVYADNSNVLRLAFIHKKSNSLYQVVQASDLAGAKAECAELFTGRLATPQEVLKLSNIKDVVKDLGPLLNTPDDPAHVRGFYDSAEDYFKINIASKKVETYVREENQNSPVVCMQDYEKVKQKMKDAIGAGFNEFFDEAIQIIKDAPRED